MYNHGKIYLKLLGYEVYSNLDIFKEENYNYPECSIFKLIYISLKLLNYCQPSSSWVKLLLRQNYLILILFVGAFEIMKGKCDNV